MVVSDAKNQDEVGGGADADADGGEKQSQFYMYKLPIDRSVAAYH